MEIWRYTGYKMDYSQFVRKISILVKKNMFDTPRWQPNPKFIYIPSSHAKFALPCTFGPGLKPARVSVLQTRRCERPNLRRMAQETTERRSHDIDEIIPQCQGTGVKFWRNRFSTSVVEPIISHPQFHPKWWVKTIQKWRIKFGSTPCLSSND